MGFVLNRRFVGVYLWFCYVFEVLGFFVFCLCGVIGFLFCGMMCIGIELLVGGLVNG